MEKLLRLQQRLSSQGTVRCSDVNSVANSSRCHQFVILAMLCKSLLKHGLLNRPFVVYLHVHANVIEAV